MPNFKYSQVYSIVLNTFKNGFKDIDYYGYNVKEKVLNLDHKTFFQVSTLIGLAVCYEFGFH